jgi:HSP20 family protein
MSRPFSPAGSVFLSRRYPGEEMAQSTEWDPMSDLMSVQKQMNELFENALAKVGFEPDAGVGSWMPVADVFDEPGVRFFCLELPGLSLEDIEVRIDGDELIVEGDRRMERGQPGEQFHRVERSYGKFARRFRLPSSVDRGSVKAKYRNGVLAISLDKKSEAEPEKFDVSID